MQLATSGYSTKRSPAGLGVTILVHAGLAALAVVGLRSVAPPKAVPPLVTYDIPDALKPPPTERKPDIRNKPVPVEVSPPSFEQADPPKAENRLPFVTDQGGGGNPVGPQDETQLLPLDPVKLPPGITSSARIDPRYRADFEAPYPAASRRMGEEGTVIVRVVVGIDGRVVRAVVARSSGFERLDAAALKQALAKWRFVAALSDGRPVEAEREIPVTFRLAG